MLTNVMKTFTAFLNFCYITWKTALTEDNLNTLDTTLQRFHHYCNIFWDMDVQPDGFSLPHQHTLVRYHKYIENFGTPNGLCSSITESKHIAAVKKPWHRLSWYNALQRMLATNTQNDQLMAAQADFESHGMLEGTCLGEMLHTLSGNQDNTDGDANEDTTPILKERTPTPVQMAKATQYG